MCMRESWKRSTGALFMVLFVLVVCRPCLAEEAAMVMELIGPPPIFSHPERVGEEVVLFEFLSPGDQLDLFEGGLMNLIFFATSVREAITGPGKIEIEAGRSRVLEAASILRESLDSIPSNVHVDPEDREHVGLVPIRGYGEQTERRVLLSSLSNTAVQPGGRTFRWRPVPDAEYYELELYDPEGNLILRTATKETEFHLEGGELISDRPYQWVVRARAGGKILAEGLGVFHRLNDEDLGRMKSARTKIEEELGRETDAALMSLALLFRRYELNDNADIVLRRLLKEHPDNINLALMIRALDSNYQWRLKQ